MTLHQPKARLIGTTKAFRGDWLDLKAHWRDQKCREFNDRYMEELFHAVDQAVVAMDDLDKVLTKIREDCDVETTDR